ncbi:MAG: HAD family hydrolase [Stellaceae bacterium]|jgi:HAD superfamily hydrolase (TIGR01509 family)
MTPDLVIFDCDGVLVDSEPIVNRAHATALTGCGYPITADDLVDRFCGLSDADMFAIIERERGCALPLSYAALVGDIIEQQFRRSLRAIFGVREVLDALPSARCVASSSTHDMIRRKLELTGLSPCFGEMLFSAEMVSRGKPAPDLFLHAAAQMDVAPARCVVVEDSAAGITAARTAGMAAIGFCGGGHCRPGHAERLRACGAVLVIAEMGELADAISRLP